MAEAAADSLLYGVVRSRRLLVDCEGLEGRAIPGLAVLFGSGGHDPAVVDLSSEGGVGPDLADLLSTA
ncbi:MAG: hypothetical protein WA809_09030, partial [Candidatus Dormiibacterota bacterium]